MQRNGRSYRPHRQLCMEQPPRCLHKGGHFAVVSLSLEGNWGIGPYQRKGVHYWRVHPSLHASGMRRCIWHEVSVCFFLAGWCGELVCCPVFQLIGSGHERIQLISFSLTLPCRGRGYFCFLKSDVHEILCILCLRRAASGCSSAQLQKHHGMT